MKCKQSFLLVALVGLVSSVFAMDFYCEIEQDELIHRGITETILSGITLEDIVNFFIKNQGYSRTIMSKDAMRNDLQVLFVCSETLSGSPEEITRLLLEKDFELDDIEIFIKQCARIVTLRVHNVYPCVLMQIAKSRIENSGYFKDCLHDSVTDGEHNLIKGSYCSVKNLIRCAWKKTNNSIVLDFEKLMQDVERVNKKDSWMLRSPIGVSEYASFSRHPSCDDGDDI